MVNVLQRFLAAGAVLLAFAFTQAWAEGESERFALVIGNGGYESVPALRNPPRDASDVAEELDGLGFKVTLGVDVDRKKFRRLINDFVQESLGASDVVFFFAGHGFQIGNVNHLVPVDAMLESRDRIDRETVSLNDVIAALQARPHRTIILLDACRNNPLPEAIRRKEDGLGLAEVDTGRDLFVAFATEPGRVAFDGRGRNSPFTEALLRHMTRPGLSISDMMVDLRKDVFTSTQYAQLPWDQSSLRSPFQFVPAVSMSEQLAEASRNNNDIGARNTDPAKIFQDEGTAGDPPASLPVEPEPPPTPLVETEQPPPQTPARPLAKIEPQPPPPAEEPIVKDEPLTPPAEPIVKSESPPLIVSPVPIPSDSMVDQPIESGGTVGTGQAKVEPPLGPATNTERQHSEQWVAEADSSTADSVTRPAEETRLAEKKASEKAAAEKERAERAKAEKAKEKARKDAIERKKKADAEKARQAEQRIKDAARKKAERPNAREYSFKIWAFESFFTNKTARSKTEFGTLSCRIFVKAKAGREKARFCHWE